MDKESIKSCLDDLKKNVISDGGDYEILELEDNYVKLKIKGKKNNKRSSDNLYALIKFTMHKKFPKEKIRVEMEHWKMPSKNPVIIKLKNWFNIETDDEE